MAAAAPATLPAREDVVAYALALADDALILGHRLSEWCGHAPMLEEDLALANLALDLIGQARSLYQYAGEVEGAGRDEDALAYRRKESEYRNCLLVERPNGDFAMTIVRHALYAPYALRLHQALTASRDETLSAIAAKAVKEMAYHERHAGEWLIRLGDGTAESHARAQEALEELWPYADELFAADEAMRRLIEAGVAPDPAAFRADYDSWLNAVLAEATLSPPTTTARRAGGRQGRHTEAMGFLLAELQHMQRTYPGATW